VSEVGCLKGIRHPVRRTIRSLTDILCVGQENTAKMVGNIYEETDSPLERILCEMDDGSYIVGVVCQDCFCILKYEGICHLCPCDPDYWNPQEHEEFRDFIAHLGDVYSIQE